MANKAWQSEAFIAVDHKPSSSWFKAVVNILYLRNALNNDRFRLQRKPGCQSLGYPFLPCILSSNIWISNRALLEEFDLAAGVGVYPVLDSLEEHRKDCWRANVDESSQALRIVLLTDVKEHLSQPRVAVSANAMVIRSNQECWCWNSWLRSISFTAVLA